MTRRRKILLLLLLGIFILAEVLYLWTMIQSPASESPGDPAASRTSVAGGARAPGVGAMVDEGRARAQADAALFRLLRTEPPARDLVDLAARMGRLEGPVAAATPAAPRAIAVGDRETFWLHDINGERYFQVGARLEAIAPHAYLWVQDGQTFDREALERGGRDFTKVYEAVRGVFGAEWSPGVDGDPRLHILHHEPIAGIAGYFYSSDEYPVAVEPHSNQREMFYINLSATTPGAYDYQALLAHEFQHMIHWNEDRDEAVWVNEGLSELAARVAGYPVQTGGQFFGAPDTPLLEWQHESSPNAAHYAAAYAFFAYLRQRYGDDAIRALVAAPANGARGVEAALAAAGDPRPFEDVFLEWVVANAARPPGGDDAARRYGYGDLDLARAQPEPLGGAGPGGGAIDGAYPAATDPYPAGPSPAVSGARPPAPASSHTATVSQYGTDYYEVTSHVRGGRLALAFEGDREVGLLDPVTARPGAVWWSGRGDNMDGRLTRAFDLTGAPRARLTLRMWYDLEENWDYAYVQVSADGGDTWTRLATPRTTDTNPNGNNFGQGLTGASGGWVDEAIDLSPYAGGPVLVRFEVVTDDAVHLSGLALDDLVLEAVGFADDAEHDAGWKAEGWVRVDPLLPQRWAVQVITDSPAHGLAVHRLPVAADGAAAIDVAGIAADARVTLAVTALTPGTRNVAGYRVGGGSE